MRVLSSTSPGSPWSFAVLKLSHLTLFFLPGGQEASVTVRDARPRDRAENIKHRGKKGYTFGNKAPSPIPSCSPRAGGNNVWCVFRFLLQWDYHWFKLTYSPTLLLTPIRETQAVLSPWAGHRTSHVCRIPPMLFTALTSARFLGPWKISIYDQGNMDK